MKVAFVCYETFFSGGISVYVRELLNRIAVAGHRVVLFAPPPREHSIVGLVPEIELRIVAVPTLPLTGVLGFGIAIPLLLRRLERREGPFDIVHSNTYADAFLPKKATRGVRISTVYHLGTTAARSMELSIASRLAQPSSEYGPGVALEGLCLRRASHLIAVSQFTRSGILRQYPDIDPNRVSVIYLGATRRFSNSGPGALERLRSGWGISASDQIFLCVGRLESRKGIRFLFDVFSRLGRAASGKLVLVGSGDQTPYRRLASDLGIADRVVFAGFVDEKTLNEAYSLATALLHPSAIEGFGLAVADAVASGLPVVACRVGSIPEIVRDGIDGHLVRYGDVEAFRDAILKILQRAFVGEIDRTTETSRKFTWSATAAETLSLYERLVSTKNAM